MLFARLIVATTLLAPYSASAGDLLGTPAFPRHRPGLASAGPRGLPDTSRPNPAALSAAKYPVEPASFQSTGDTQPLVGHHALWPEDTKADSNRAETTATVTHQGTAKGTPEYGGSAESTFVFRNGFTTGIESVTGLKQEPLAKPSAPALPVSTPPALAMPSARGSTPTAAPELVEHVTSDTPAIRSAESSSKSKVPGSGPSRSFALPSNETTVEADKDFRPDNPLKTLLAWRPSTASMTTAGSALALVLGLLCLSAWVVKRSLPRSARVLPTDVAEVLGRVPLAGRQVGQLVRVGRKLLLVATTPNGIETLTEITDEEDVQNLLRICDEAHGRGAQAAFDDVFRQMTREPARPGFLGEEALDYDPRQLAAAYARTPGGRASA
jgi:flagellar biogenesis protein FliO